MNGKWRGRHAVLGGGPGGPGAPVVPIRGEAAGKLILIGEHAVVYGAMALAVTLRDLPLVVTLDPVAHCTSWDEGWCLRIDGALLETSLEQRVLMTRALSCALEDARTRARAAGGLEADVHPYRLTIDSRLPVAAGLGASAALSVALIQIADRLMGAPPCSRAEIACRANVIDALFHGRASGVDTAAAAGQGVIAFTRGEPPRAIPVRQGFWLALIDSGEPKSTTRMVARVAERRVQHPGATNLQLESIAQLAYQARKALEEGALPTLGVALDRAHHALQALELSTPRLDALVTRLREAGALGAKLTGAGGGGVAFGLFEARTPALEAALRGIDPVWWTEVLPQAGDPVPAVDLLHPKPDLRKRSAQGNPTRSPRLPGRRSIG